MRSVPPRVSVWPFASGLSHVAFRGLAASRAESLWLSDCSPEHLRLCRRGEASSAVTHSRKAGGFPHGERQSRQAVQRPREAEQRPRSSASVTLRVDFLESHIG